MKLNVFRFKFLLILIIVNASAFGQGLIIDHRAVEKYTEIPQEYIDSIKKMWVSVPGESHSGGYRKGMDFLEEIDNRFKVVVRESGTPDASIDTSLRFSRATWGNVDSETGWRYGYGEEDWYTSETAVDRTKASISYCNSNDLSLSAIGFGWCWDMTWQNGVGGEIDTIYQVRWAGSSVGGPQGSMRWGLDYDDSLLTGNSVNMDTYINATLEYISHCEQNGYPTKVFFTTGPVDGGGNNGESGYQRFIKHEYLRQYILQHSDMFLFDYADILNWGDDGTQNTTTWTDHGGTQQEFPLIHQDNMLDLDGTYDEDGDHIGERGTVRLAKAMWYMLAVMSGWDGIPDQYTHIENISMCYGNSIMFNDQEINETGTYYDTLMASDGLDSILICNVTVNPHVASRIFPMICEGEQFFAQGDYQTESGMYYDTLTNVNGCDSIIYTQLSVEECPVNSVKEVTENIYYIYPNPSTNNLFLEIQFEKPVCFSLISSSGQCVHTNTYNPENSILKDIINVENFPRGIYVAKFESDNKVILEKIILTD